MRNLTLITSFCLLQAGCGLAPPSPYIFYSPSLANDEVASVKVQRGFGKPAVLLDYFDGIKATDYSSMSGYPKDAYEANRIEPRWIQVSQGLHTYGVRFAYTDVTGKIVTSDIVRKLVNKHLPDIEDGPMTVYHSEDIAFSAKAKKTYIIKYSWDKEAEELSFYVDECDSQDKNCKKIDITSSKKNTKVEPGFIKVEQVRS